MSKGGNLGKASLVLSTKDDTGKGLKKAEGGVKGWASGLKGKVGGALAGIGGLLAGAFGAGKLFERTSSLADVGKQAAALGIASDTFMGLSQAAKEAGVESEQFGTLLQKAQIKIAEGSPDVQAALGQMGMTLADLRGKSPDEIFYAVADGLNGVSDQGTRAMLATKLFEEEGAKLLPVMSRGSAGLKEFVAQQRAMGTAMGQSDMNGIMAAQAKVTAIGRRWEGFLDRLTAGAAPFLSVAMDIGETVVSWLPAFADVKTYGMATFQVLGQAGGYVWDTLKAGAGGFAGGLGAIVMGWGAIADAMGLAEGKAMILAGKGMFDWGEQQFNSFGQTAKDVEKWFLNMNAPKIGEKIGQKAGEQMAKSFAVRLSDNPAIERGSAEDFSARIRWQEQGLTLQQQQLKIAEKTAANTAATVAALKDVASKIGFRNPLKAV